jgi:hypothetical protein
MQTEKRKLLEKNREIGQSAEDIYQLTHPGAIKRPNSKGGWDFDENDIFRGPVKTEIKSGKKTKR